MIILMLGPPGSGKGTQSDFLVKYQNFVHVSIGEVLRGEIEKSTLLGLRVKNIIDAGNLVDDDTINELATIKLNDFDFNNNNIVVDGYPRSLIQAQYILHFLNKHNLLIINFNIDENEIVDRLSSRVQCNKCQKITNYDIASAVSFMCTECGSMNFIRRKDDDKDTIITRLNNYYKVNNQIIKFCKEHKSVFDIDASQNKNIIYEEIVKLINKT